MGNLTVVAPDGAHFEFEPVRTEHGTKDLGEVPILVWDDEALARACYGAEGITDILDGTSLRVSFQGIARRYRIAGKSDDESAKTQIAFRPGKRAVGVSTPVSRAANMAKKASEKVSGDKIAEFLQQIADGKISEEDLAGLVG
jgi:anti-sigma28 factor (negative regulator of flagellin synthesis)